ncbi:MAG: hypothetical protein ACW98D_17415 [Promethearchaeota archaeon]|jgi:hypothetical protein
MPLTTNFYEIHLGTSWDFFNSSKFSVRSQFNQLAKGMINLCEDIENGKLSKDAKFKGYTTYFNISTINKFGFSYRSFNFIESILFGISYIELCILKSVVQKKLTFIPFNNLKVVKISAKDLLKYKVKYQEFLTRSFSNTFSRHIAKASLAAFENPQQLPDNLI